MREFRDIFTRNGLRMGAILTVKRDGRRSVSVIAPVANLIRDQESIYLRLWIENGKRKARFIGIGAIDLDPKIVASEEVWEAIEAWFEEVTNTDAPTENERVAEGI